MEFFAKTVKNYNSQSTVLDFWPGSEYAISQ